MGVNVVFLFCHVHSNYRRKSLRFLIQIYILKTLFSEATFNRRAYFLLYVLGYLLMIICFVTGLGFDRGVEVVGIDFYSIQIDLVVVEVGQKNQSSRGLVVQIQLDVAETMTFD